MKIFELTTQLEEEQRKVDRLKRDLQQVWNFSLNFTYLLRKLKAQRRYLIVHRFRKLEVIHYLIVFQTAMLISVQTTLHL